MKILQVIPYYLPSNDFGGTPVVCHNLSLNLTRMGNEVTVLTTDAYSQNRRLPRSLKNENYGYSVLRFKNLNNFLAFRFKFVLPFSSFLYFSKHLKDFDIVHLNEYRTLLNVFACIFKPKRGVKFILHAQGTYANYGNNIFYKKVFDIIFKRLIDKKIDCYLAISGRERLDLIHHGIEKSKIQVFYNGIDNVRSTRPRFNVPDLYILYLGQISKRKGVDHLLKSFSKCGLQTKGFKLLIVGRDDGYLTQLKEVIHVNTARSVIFHESVSEAEARYLMKKARLVYYVAQNEAFGLVPLEAAIVGTESLVASDSGVSEVLRRYKLGELINFGDTEKITHLLQKYSKDKIRVPTGKIKKITKDFSWLGRTRELLKIYDSII